MTTVVAGPARARGAPGRPSTTSSGTARWSAPLLVWAALAIVLLSRVYRTMLLSLVAIAILPTLGSWTGFVVRTGSMEPSIAVGDVVIARPFGAAEKVPVGRVMIFRDPAAGAGSKVLVHRVVARAGHNTYTTAGDANRSNDANPVPRANFRARAIIRVPYVGLPLVWLAGGRVVPLSLWLVVTTLMLYLSFRPIDGGGRRGGHRLRPRRPARRALRREGPRAVRGVIALLVLAAVLAIPEPADAAFTTTTQTGSNTWTASGTLRQPYVSAVLADSPYAFYLFDEASGATAADRSGNNRTGSYTSVSAYRQAGALVNNFGYAIGLAANSGRMVGGGTGLTDPTTFSVELWFKTTTAAGGKLIGFENTQNATSTSFDREAFMRTDGKVVYMGATSTSKLLVSPTALNNGTWHQLVITSVPSGSQENSVMYVDGAQVATGNTSKAASSYLGWWRVGFGKVPSGSGYPSTGNFTGSVDNASIYTTALTGARVAAHYAAR